MNIKYDQEADALYIRFQTGKVKETLKMRDGILIDIGRNGKIFGIEPVFRGAETETALLSNASKCRERFGPPTVTVDQMIEWIAPWVSGGGASLGKPTHFEQRDGRF